MLVLFDVGCMACKAGVMFDMVDVLWIPRLTEMV
jgi:hypothetical protein